MNDLKALPHEAGLEDLRTWLESNPNGGTPPRGPLGPILATLRSTVTEKCRVASIADAAFFRDLVAALALLPLETESRQQIDLARDCARYFYIAGLRFEAIGPLGHAQSIADAGTDLNDRAIVLAARGAIYADTGNIAEAVEVYSRALDIVRATGATFIECRCWLNLGTALIYAGEHRMAMASLRRAIEIGADDGETATGDAYSCRSLRSMANNNIALVCFHIHDIKQGIDAIDAAIVDRRDPSNAADLMSAVLLAGNATRLLLQAGQQQRARGFVDEAIRYAAAAQSPRLALEADIVEGMFRVYTGDTEAGIAQLQSARERALSDTRVLPEILLSLVKAFEHAGQPENALQHLNEYIDLRQAIQQEYILGHLTVTVPGSDQSGHDADVSLAEVQVTLHGQVSEHRADETRYKMLLNVALTAELRDDNTGENVYRVGRLAAMLATETGEPPEVAHAIELAGRLHDIGKCSVPDTVVGKPGQLTTEEVQIMQRHAGIGAEILSKTPIQSLPQAAAIARSHHEWWDGSGYPDGLAGEDIPLAARLVGMAETFDCLVHQRPYKRAWTADAALAEIAALSGKQFEPRLVDAFVRLVKRLIAEHDNIDEFLSHEAKKSQFLRTRANIASALRNAKPA